MGNCDNIPLCRRRTADIGLNAQAISLGSSCSIQPLLPCTEALLTYNSVTPLQYYVTFTNQLGSILYFPPNSLNISTSSIGGGTNYQYGNCQPSFASKGSSVICAANIIVPSKPQAGSQVLVTFTLNYNICNSNSKSSCAAGHIQIIGRLLGNGISRRRNAGQPDIHNNAVYRDYNTQRRYLL